MSAAQIAGMQWVNFGGRMVSSFIFATIEEGKCPFLSIGSSYLYLFFNCFFVVFMLFCRAQRKKPTSCEVGFLIGGS
ncbi:MAG: hypothetical protein RR311_20640 [Comamonas sp.]|uniref:hypothetical protein n=1 Tax=Acidovorax sp. CCYZU-2555 TaxID=2835042 RepID=UPI001BCB43EC|nr:hypothetical protein [Acidovorax sp. CCYZU-2555]MBS7777144.1 hypothetical protein [Acidovorax sp. CCYZU-2555]